MQAKVTVLSMDIWAVSNMCQLFKEIYLTWIEAREAYVKARMVNGHWF